MNTIPHPPSGGQLRDAALAALAARRPALVRDIQRAAVRLALDRGELTADDLRAAVTIPPGIRPVVVGAAVRMLAVAGILVHAGYRKSLRPVAHRRPLAVWRLADAARAAAWLADHPPLPAE